MTGGDLFNFLANSMPCSVVTDCNASDKLDLAAGRLFQLSFALTEQYETCAPRTRRQSRNLEFQIWNNHDGP
jgi:hypothetical protein